MSKRIAIVDAVRTPMTKAGTDLKRVDADVLGAIPVREVLARIGIAPREIDEVIIGNVVQPVHAANVARVIALRAGIPKEVPAVTVHRNCASGMESITTGAQRLLIGDAKIIVAGGVESMSNIPLLFNQGMTDWLEALSKAKTAAQKLKLFLKMRPAFFKPIIGLLVGLTDPICNLIMGMTAENLARDFHITREEQDLFSLGSHQKATQAIESGRFAEESMAVPIPPKYDTVLLEDNGPRRTQSIEALKKLKPFFDRKNGTVTVGSSSQITDGAAATVLMKESDAKALGWPVLGYLKGYAYAGCAPDRMGLGPVHATAKLFDRLGITMKEIELIEMNEAFAAQVLANLKAFSSNEFADKELNRATALGEIDPEKLNVNGGAIALGHPLGMTGTRLVLTLLQEMKQRQLQTGLATLCVGGGQGAALLLERE